MNLQEYLSDKREIIDYALDAFLPREDNEPFVLHRAMRYSVFAGGKRVRPILAMAAAEAIGGDSDRVLPLGVALECIHTYSLIHDDLPAMDDDDLRRGKPSAHRAFGEAVAILAGDALLTFAFEVLASPRMIRVHRSETILSVIRELARAAGSSKLIAGQAADMQYQGQSVGVRQLDYIIRNKTAALIRASVGCGARLAGGARQQVAQLEDFGEKLGIAFQLRDDLLDLEGDVEKLGKTVRKDDAKGKATYPAVLGQERSREFMTDLLREALDCLKTFGASAEALALITRYVGERAH